MLRQFILTFFLIALALPATATPAPAAGPATAMEDCHGMPAQDEDSDQQHGDMRLHGCIGCIAPISAVVVVASGQGQRFRPFAAPIRRLSGTTPRPSLPPPRV